MNVTFINMNQLDGLASANTIPILHGYIASYLGKYGHSSEILNDVKDAPLTLEELDRHMRIFRPGIVGFSGYQYLMERIRFYAKFIKLFYPETCVVLGGPQALFMNGDALDDLADFDVICSRGDGETTVLALAEALENKESFNGIKGISFRRGNEIINTAPPERFPDNLDIIPSPYVSGIITPPGKGKAIVFTSRGCEHICNFCVTPFYNRRRIRFHSVEHVLEEMKFLESASVESLWIGDPHFTADRERTVELMKRKIENGIKIPFWCQTRVDMVDEELLLLMKEAGLIYIGFGLESGNDGVLETMNKNVNVSKFHEIVSFTQSIGVSVDLFSMYGQPGETFENAKKTIDIVRQYNIPVHGNSQAQQLQLTYGSVYGKAPEKYGFRTGEGYRPKYLSYWHDYETDCLSKKDLNAIHMHWNLYNAQTEEDIRNGLNIFHTIDFLETNKNLFRSEKEFYRKGLYLGSMAEDSEMMLRYTNEYIKKFNPGSGEISEFLPLAEIYETDSEVREKSRVIIFCEYPQGFTPGAGMPKSGLNDLRNIDISALKGMKANESRILNLPGADIRVTVLRVFRRLKINKLKQLGKVKVRQNYSFITLDILRRSDDERLSFFAFRDMPAKELLKMPALYMSLVSFYTKMHSRKEIDRCLSVLLGAVNNKEAVFTAFGDISAIAGKYKEAAEYYQKAGSSEDVLLKKANAMVQAEEFDEAYWVLSKISGRNSVEYKDIMLSCIKNIYPGETERIRQLEEELMTEKVERIFGKSRDDIYIKA